VGIIANGATPIDLEFIDMKWTIISTLKHVIPFIFFLFFYLEVRKQGYVKTYNFKTEWQYLLIVPLIIVPIVIVCQWIPVDVSQDYCGKIFHVMGKCYIVHGKGFSFYGNITCVNKELEGYSRWNFFGISIAAPLIYGIEWFLLWINNKLIKIN